MIATYTKNKNNIQSSQQLQQTKNIWLKKYFWKSLNTKLDHSPHRNKNESIQGIRQLAYFIINIGKTLGKLHWKSKIQLQRNGMAAIPKMSNNMWSFQKIKSQDQPSFEYLLELK